MATPRRRAGNVAVRIDPDVWREEVERFNPRSPGRVTAERERRRLEKAGVSYLELQGCADEGRDRTRLGGLLKVYTPIDGAAVSQRPFGFVFSPEPSDEGLCLALVAFGERHPPRGTRSVYERAHKRLHGRYPDQ